MMHNFCNVIGKEIYNEQWTATTCLVKSSEVKTSHKIIVFLFNHPFFLLMS